MTVSFSEIRKADEAWYSTGGREVATSVLKMLCMNCEFGGERKEGEAHKGALSTQKSCLIHNIHLADSTNLSNVIFASINPKFFFY